MTATAALFDLDGTLTDPEVGITTCIAYGLEKIGAEVPPQSALRDWIGAPLQETLFDHLGSRVLADEALKGYRERFEPIGMFENVLYDGMREALAAVREHCSRLYVVTSKPTVFAEKILRHFELTSWFDAVYGSELDGRYTNKRELVAYVADRHALEASRSVMIGDRRFDIEAARCNGMKGLGVLWGFGSLDELRTAGADAVCARVDALPSQVTALLRDD
ncbi:MAG: HAD hydrolase-like protein [Woeseiaceae bacterium]|nr:HAD hydrolase-like protein [Woeseiaceae bacterium]